MGGKPGNNPRQKLGDAPGVEFGKLDAGRAYA